MYVDESNRNPVLNLSTIYAHVDNRVCVQQIGTLKTLTFLCLCLTAGWVEQFYVVFGVTDVFLIYKFFLLLWFTKVYVCSLNMLH